MVYHATLPRVRRHVAARVRKEDGPVLRVAEGPLKDEVERLWGTLRGRLSAAEAERLVTDLAALSDDVEALYASLETRLTDLLGQSAVEAGIAELESLGVDRADLRFDLVNPRAQQFAQTHAGELIAQATAEQIATVRDLVARGIRDGLHPRVIAQDIADSVGLTSRYANAVANVRRASLADGLSEQAAQEAAQRAAQRLLKARGNAIARTEMIRAAARGQAEAWEAARVDGLLDTSVAVKEWIASLDDRVDPVCENLDGAQVPYDQPFPSDYEPPVHTNCRCTIGIRDLRTLSSKEQAALAESRGKTLVSAESRLGPERFNEEGVLDPGGEYAENPLARLQGRDIREAASSVRDSTIEAYGRVENVSPAEVQIMSGQRTVRVSRVQEYINNPARTADIAEGTISNDLLIVRRNGKMAVLDGNHRVAAAYLREGTIPAIVLDMDTAFAEARAIQIASGDTKGILLAMHEAAQARIKR